MKLCAALFLSLALFNSALARPETMVIDNATGDVKNDSAGHPPGLPANTKLKGALNANAQKINNLDGVTETAGARAKRGQALEVYIANRETSNCVGGVCGDGLDGSGTRLDPYNGGTQAKFDAIMGDSTKTPAGAKIRLQGPLFQTAVSHSWALRSGWVIEGDGMYATTVQFTGSATGISGATMFGSSYGTPANNFIIRDLTCDLNWAALANSTTTAGSDGTRATITANTVTSSATVTVSAGTFTTEDIGRVLTWSGSPSNVWIGAINSSTSIEVSSSPVSNVPMTVSITNGTTLVVKEKNFVMNAVYAPGSRTLTERVRMINSYGSTYNGLEAFGIAAATPNTGESEGNEIRFCRAELPWGSYGAPFTIHGYGFFPNPPYYYSNNASVHDCIAIGRSGGTVAAMGFTSGGVNLAWQRYSKIYNNTFIDCFTIAYQDTGFFDGVDVGPNNTLVRGGYGVGFTMNGSGHASTLKNAVRIFGNNIGISNTVVGGHAYGIVLSTDQATKYTAAELLRNTITYDSTGGGSSFFHAISVGGATIPKIEANTVPEGSDGNVSATTPYMARNRTPLGKVPIGLEDSERAFYVTDLGNVSNQVPDWATLVVIASPSALTNHMFIKAPYHSSFERFVILDPYGRINGSTQLIVQRHPADTVINGTTPGSGDIVAATSAGKTVSVRTNKVNGIHVYTDIHSTDSVDELQGTLSIAKGGTGATSAAGARTNIGGIIGTVAFDAGSGTITNKVVKGIVSDVTRTVAGEYAITFTSNQADTNYIVNANHGGGTDDITDGIFPSSYAVGGFSVYVMDNAFDKHDVNKVRISIIRLP